jgi:hypothetical protein
MTDINTGGRKKTNIYSKTGMKKVILGKERCIYKIAKDRKEYVKYKGELVTVKYFKEVHKPLKKGVTKRRIRGGVLTNEEKKEDDLTTAIGRYIDGYANTEDDKAKITAFNSHYFTKNTGKIEDLMADLKKIGLREDNVEITKLQAYFLKLNDEYRNSEIDDFPKRDIGLITNYINNNSNKYIKGLLDKELKKGFVSRLFSTKKKNNPTNNTNRGVV